jgi:hypothetical protein
MIDRQPIDRINVCHIHDPETKRLAGRMSL